MSNKKIKIFLGAFSNSTNAQNIYCRGLALNLDKSKFEVYTLQVYSGNLPKLTIQDKVHVFNCFRPFGLSIYLGFLWGFLNCDVVFLPKIEGWRFNRLLLKIFKRKSFKTIDGILDKDNLNSAVHALGSYKIVIRFYSYLDKVYPLTQFLGLYNKAHHNIKIEPKTLYLGSDTKCFINDQLKSGELNKVVFIGRLMKRKGIYDFLQIAQFFPTIEFNIFGNGEEKAAVEEFIESNNLTNVLLRGTMGHEGLGVFLKEVDLHIFPSRSEGFGLVTLETAAAGVPSLLYDDYGVGEWVSHGINGWILKNVDEMIAVITDLKNNPLKLQKASVEALKLAQSFDWKIRVKDWEEVILQLANERN